MQYNFTRDSFQAYSIKYGSWCFIRPEDWGCCILVGNISGNLLHEENYAMTENKPTGRSKHNSDLDEDYSFHRRPNVLLGIDPPTLVNDTDTSKSQIPSSGPRQGTLRAQRGKSSRIRLKYQYGPKRTALEATLLDGVRRGP